ncbi:hypothetical protein ACQ4M4_08320 [Leptolyngbya sp. AN02str]|uniref:hypothetical protein n=1 Tax=Leptolyngbya sp. AN02str TaxID=3423363 RepID=UPI003D316BCB
MHIVICPGIHSHEATQQFLAALESCFQAHRLCIMPDRFFPGFAFPVFSGWHVFQHIEHTLGTPAHTPGSLLFLGFSAGVVGALGAAHLWQSMGGRVAAFIAIDGWGVPLWGNFPIHRLSHDHFTQWSSALMGAGDSAFYAEPSVEHLELWRSPQIATGYWHASPHAQPFPIPPDQLGPITAAQVIQTLVQHYADADRQPSS